VLGAGNKALGQLFPNDLVNWQKNPPVESACDASWGEPRKLPQPGSSVIFGTHTPFEPGAARHLHLRPEPEQRRLFVRFDSKKIEGVADSPIVWVSATTSHADSADELVEPAA